LAKKRSPSDPKLARLTDVGAPLLAGLQNFFVAESEPVQQTANIGAVHDHPASFQFDAQFVQRHLPAAAARSRTKPACDASLPQPGA